MTETLGIATPRRRILQAGAGLVGGALAASLPDYALAADQAPLGTWPVGSSGPSVFVGLTVPRTGSYDVAGEDEIKGALLAIEHINSGDPLIRKIATKITKGLLGKQVTHGIADSQAKPNVAVENGSRFISENKAVVIAGCVSSAEAVAGTTVTRQPCAASIRRMLRLAP